MAFFYLRITSLSRSTGRSAVASAAYRAGERLREERTGHIHNHSRRQDVAHAEILLPEQFAGQTLAWARNRESLWNTADRAEKRYNSRVAREFQVTLPAELSAEQRINLARSFSGELAQRYGVAVDLAVHDPRPEGDPRNFHAHLLATTREVTPTGFGAKAGLDIQIVDRRRRGLPDHRQEYINVRERWAVLVNGALRDAGLDERVDHRSYEAQGIDREPKPQYPAHELRLERRGGYSEVVEEIRSQYHERVRLRAERALLAKASPSERVVPSAEQSRQPAQPAPAADLEEVRRRAREAWLALRREAQAGQAAGPVQEASLSDQQADDDLAR